MMDYLHNLRNIIDEIDLRLVELVAKRMSIVKEVGEYKKARGIAPLDEKRWQEVLETKIKLARELGVSEDLIVDLYNRMHETALELESEV